jgi:hypothetical protein
LAPSDADYATADGNVPEGVTPRQFIFDDPDDRPHTELGISLGIPIWVTRFTPDVDPGLSFAVRLARRFGWVAPELTIGWQTNWLDKDDTRLGTSYRRSSQTLDAFFFSAGARLYMLPHAAPVTPFISGALDLLLWHESGDNRRV